MIIRNLLFPLSLLDTSLSPCSEVSFTGLLLLSSLFILVLGPTPCPLLGVGYPSPTYQKMTGWWAIINKTSFCAPLHHVRGCLLPPHLHLIIWTDVLLEKNYNSQHALLPGFFLQRPPVNNARSPSVLCLYCSFPHPKEKKERCPGFWLVQILNLWVNL